jgi:tetratricopeptide (TPR) repeat protein
MAGHNTIKIAEQRGDLDNADRLYESALITYRQIGNRPSESVVLLNLGNLAKARKQYDDAEKYYRQAITIDEDLGDTANLATDYSNLGACLLDQDKLIESRKAFEYGLKLSRQVRRNQIIASALHGLACIDEREGHLQRALHQVEESLLIQERLHDRDLSNTRALVERLRGKLKG